MARSRRRSSCWRTSGYEAGGWRVEKHPRFLADLTGDGRADIVGFGDAGVWTALSNGDGTFQAPRFVLANFGFKAGGWRVDKHPRFLADMTGDGRADIVGFGDAGVLDGARAMATGRSRRRKLVLADFGLQAGGWRVDKHPRFLADITGDGRADIVGFGDAGVWTALSNGDGTFQRAEVRARRTSGSRPAAGGSRSTRASSPTSPATAAQTSSASAMPGCGRRSAMATGRSGLRSSCSATSGTRPVAGGSTKHPRFLADITGDGRADIVGFGDAGVYMATANADGFFPAPLRFVLANFGTRLTILAIARSDREIEGRRHLAFQRRWRHLVARPLLPASGRRPARRRPAGLGARHCPSRVRCRRKFVGGQPGRRRDLADCRKPGGSGAPPTPVPANHVAVAATPGGTLRPPAVYALARNMIQVSLDGGDTWMPDAGPHSEPDRRRRRAGQLEQRVRHGRVAALPARGVRHARCERAPEPAPAVAR